MALRKFFGPGTVLAVLVAVVFLVLGERGRSDSSAVALPTRDESASVPLFKPEPAWFLERSATLALTSGQSARLRSLQSAWESEKRDRLDAMRRSTGGVGTQGRRTMQALQDDLGDYSRQSVAYDVARIGYWLRAKSVLTPMQLRKGGVL